MDDIRRTADLLAIHEKLSAIHDSLYDALLNDSSYCSYNDKGKNVQLAFVQQDAVRDALKCISQTKQDIRDML